jgi:hypothetical protein
LLNFANNQATVSTHVIAGQPYLLELTIESQAVNLNDPSQLAIKAIVTPGDSRSRISAVLVIPSHGVNSQGKVIQTLQYTGVFIPASALDTLKVQLVEKGGRHITGLVGEVKLTKIDFTPLTAPAQTSLRAVGKSKSKVVQVFAKLTSGITKSVSSAKVTKKQTKKVNSKSQKKKK